MKNFPLCLFALLCAATLYAQDDGLPVRYLTAAGEYSPLYTGKMPLPYAAYFTNYPYLKTAGFTAGELSFGGIAYTGVRMRLDVYRDRLLAVPEAGGYEVILPQEQVGHALLHGYHIFYHRADSLENCPPEGYYLLLHDAGCRALARVTCSMREVSKDGETTGWFRFATRYYVLKDGVYHAVGSKGSVLKVFASHRRELSRFISERRLNFRRNTEEAIVSVVKQYELLNAGL
ncbi:MAG: hypothetical protein LBJ58_05670 [Tannerellaceae bacterium]|nr:hypothetical protein [Tannerellaceae bacterium]